MAEKKQTAGEEVKKAAAVKKETKETKTTAKPAASQAATKPAAKKPAAKPVEKAAETAAKPKKTASAAKPEKANKENAEAERAKVDLVPDDNEDIITLYDDNNNPVDFYQVACVEYEGEFYAILQPAEVIEGIADDEAVIFKLQEDPGDSDMDLFLPVDDEKVLEKVFEEFLKAVADESGCDCGCEDGCDTDNCSCKTDKK